MIEAAWGMTETHTCDTFTTGQQDGDFDLKSQPIFVGLPVPGTEFKIAAFDTGALLPLGTEGEIVVRSPSQLKSYWNKPEATAASAPRRLVPHRRHRPAGHGRASCTSSAGARRC